MRIVFFSNVASNLALFRLPVMKALKALGHEVTALAADDDRAGPIKDAGIRFVPITIDRKGWSPFAEYAAYARFLRGERPDLVFSFTPKPVLYSSFARIFHPFRTVCVITGLGYAFITRSLFTFFVKFAFRLFLGRADKIVFQNPDDLELFVRSGLAPAVKTELIKSSGVDTRYFAPVLLPGSVSGAKTMFLYVGRLLWDKGVGEFVDAAGLVRAARGDAEFHILGWFDPGNPSAVDEAFIRRKEAEGIIVYRGMLDDIRPVLAESDVVVLPSYREGTPRSLLEAASMGRPVITTDVPGCREVVRDRETGLLVPVRDAESLAVAMVWMLNHDVERREMGRKGREFIISEFEVEQVVQKYLDVVKSV